MKFKLFATACAAVLLSVGTVSAQECGLCLPNGTPVHCQVNPDGTKVWVDLNGNPVTGQTGGIGDFEVVACDCPNQVLTLEARNLDINSFNPAFGNIRTFIDPSRPATPSTLKANGDGSYTEDFYFNVLADVPGFGILTGVQELHFHSSRVKTFNPHREERFAQVNPVDFIDAAGNVILTLKATQITLVP